MQNLFLFLALGCDETERARSAATAKASLDSDGDGLADAVETAWGTDPSEDDSDRDGYSDGDELTVHDTNPLYAYSHPYAADYNVGYCSRGTAPATGPSASSSWSGGFAMYLAGDVPENF
jgi:hypothetical protein